MIFFFFLVWNLALCAFNILLTIDTENIWFFQTTQTLKASRTLALLPPPPSSPAAPCDPTHAAPQTDTQIDQEPNGI